MSTTQNQSHSRRSTRRARPTQSASRSASNVPTKSLIASASVALAAGAAFYFRRELMSLMGYHKVHVAPHIHAQLPIAKDLPTIPDFEGNYDMDGVSFDTEGVIVGSDHQAIQQIPH